MPKVTEEYIQNKKKKIVEAAINVCLRKSICSATMQDIIDESGLSQGGIYRFYRDLDDIFVDMLKILRKRIKLKPEISQILEKNLGIKETVEAVFEVLCVNMERYLLDYNKIPAEWNFFLMNHPERCRKIMAALTEEEGGFEYLFRMTREQVKKWELEGRIKPLMPVDDILAYLTSSYDGIQTEIIMREKYMGGSGEHFQVRKLMGILKESMFYLLGITE